MSFACDRCSPVDHFFLLSEHPNEVVIDRSLETLLIDFRVGDGRLKPCIDHILHRVLQHLIERVLPHVINDSRSKHEVLLVHHHQQRVVHYIHH